MLTQVSTQVRTCSQRVPVDSCQEGVPHDGDAAARPAAQPPRRVPRHERPHQILWFQMPFYHSCAQLLLSRAALQHTMAACALMSHDSGEAALQASATWASGSKWCGKASWHRITARYTA